MKKIFTYVGLLLLLYGCKDGSSSSPKGAVAALFEAAKRGDITELKKYITKSDMAMVDMGQNVLDKFNPNAAKSMMDQISKEIIKNSKDAAVDIKNEKIDGDNATVTVEYTKNGKSDTSTLSLIKEDGQWKISLLSTGMKNSGTNPADIQKAMKKINIDSLKGSINEGMQGFDKMDKDSLKKVLEEGMKALEKSKDALKKE